LAIDLQHGDYTRDAFKSKNLDNEDLFLRLKVSGWSRIKDTAVV
jgi:hypothetical protein